MDISFSEKIDTTLHYSQFNCFSTLSIKNNKLSEKFDKSKSYFDTKSMEKITLKKGDNLKKESRRKIVEKIINEGEIFDIYNPVFSSLEENSFNNVQNIKKEEVLKNSNLNSKKKKKKIIVRKIKKKSGLKKRFGNTLYSNNFNKSPELYNTHYNFSGRKVFPISEKKYKFKNKENNNKKKLNFKKKKNKKLSTQKVSVPKRKYSNLSKIKKNSKNCSTSKLSLISQDYKTTIYKRYQKRSISKKIKHKKSYTTTFFNTKNSFNNFKEKMKNDKKITLPDCTRELYLVFNK